MKQVLKRMISIALLGVLTVVLAACSNGDEAVESASAEGVLAGKTVGFAQTDNQSSWRTTETDSVAEAVEAAGGEIILKDANGDVATQDTDIRDLVAAGVDYLVAAPVEVNGLQGALKEAMDRGIHVILVDRELDGEPGVHYTTAIASDFVWQGEQAANVFTEALPEGGNVVIVNGGYDSPTSTERQAGLVDNLDPEKFNVVAEQNGNWLMSEAQSVMENIIQSVGGENIDAVFAVTDDMIQGAKAAIEGAGFTVGEDILTIGVDGSRAALEDVADGKQLASVSSSPYFGPILIETITAIENGEDIPTDITLEDTVYTIENVDVDEGY